MNARASEWVRAIGGGFVGIAIFVGGIGWWLLSTGLRHDSTPELLFGLMGCGVAAVLAVIGFGLFWTGRIRAPGSGLRAATPARRRRPPRF